MRKSKKWLEKNDELRYLPNGNEPHPIRSDKLSEAQDLLEKLN